MTCQLRHSHVTSGQGMQARSLALTTPTCSCKPVAPPTSHCAFCVLPHRRPRYLIAAGDPLQLPPVIASPSALTVTPPQPRGGGAAASTADAGGGLLRTLFVRLSQLGHTPHLLRWQYR